MKRYKEKRRRWKRPSWARRRRVPRGKRVVSPRQREAVVLLIDIGKNVSVEDAGQSFLDRGKVCASKILQRKIFSGSADEFCLTLIGSEKTDNELQYPNIRVNKYFQSANWKLLKRVEKLTPSDVTEADWLDGLIVAINLLKNESEYKKFTNLKIVFISNFGTKVRSKHQIEDVIETLQDLKINLVVVGPEIEDGNDSEENESKPYAQRKGEKIISRIVAKLDSKGLICGFQEAMAAVDTAATCTTKAAPMHVELQIGENINIPLTFYKKFVPPPALKWRKRKIGKERDEETAHFQGDKTYLQVGENVHDQEDKEGEKATVVGENVHDQEDKEVEKTALVETKVYFQGDMEVHNSDVISGYLFGQTLVPVSVDDKEAMALITEKCCHLLGFTAKKYVPRHILMGESCYYSIPKAGVKSAQIAVTALVKAMIQLDMVAIVRKVYRRGTAPRLGALIPTCENDCFFFYYSILPFAEDCKIKPPLNQQSSIKTPSFLPSLDDVCPSQQQLDAINDLIDAMDLTQFEEDEEPCYQFVNPVTEHFNNMIALRALNPESPLPSELSTALKALLQPKPEIVENASNALDNIKRLFSLEEVEQKTYRRGAADVFERNSNTKMDVEDVPSGNLVDCMAGFVQSTVTEVGTVNPENNFLKLLELGEPFIKICDQMQTVIRKLCLTSNSSIGIKKPISALSLLRKHCVDKSPLQYNQFIASLKDDFAERGHSDIWDAIIQEKLGLITKDENGQVDFTAEEAELFYEIKKIEPEEDVSYQMEAEDMLDML